MPLPGSSETCGVRSLPSGRPVRGAPAARRTRCAASQGTCRRAGRGVSVQPASVSCAALGASVVGLQETYTMRFGGRLGDPAHHLLREAGPRRVDDDHVGPGRPAPPGRAWPGGCRPRRSFAFVISFRRALSIASATAASTISTPTTSRARAASESAIVPMPEKRSKTRSWPRSARELDGRAVQALGHLRVRLEEHVGRDAELEVAEPLVQLRLAGEQRRRARPACSRRGRASASRTGRRTPPRRRARPCRGGPAR